MTEAIDLPGVAAAFGRRLHAAGVPVTPERSARFARAVALVAPVTRDRLYWTARAVYVSRREELAAFDAAFGAVFDDRADPASAGRGDPASAGDLGERAPAASPLPSRQGTVAGGGAAVATAAASRPRPEDDAREREAPLALASGAERLAERSFADLEPSELAEVRRLMGRLALAPPLRRSRRARRGRRGERLDVRATLRAGMRTGGDPVRRARRRRRMRPRRVVLLCDISGSMEPYARAYLQFLASAAGGGANAEAFTFATRLTRLTRALRGRDPQAAIRRAAASAPDWSSGTRIGAALREFNDRHGRRGLARGAVVVVLSDGWEHGDPGLVAQEMERLARLARRVLWVNPRAAAPRFAPLAGGMAAALPFCDSLLSGHSLRAMEAVVAAIAGDD